MNHDAPRSGRMRWLAGALTLTTALLAWWWLTDRTQWIPAGSFPSIAQTRDALLQSLGPGYADDRLLAHCAASLMLIVVGFVAASLVAVPLGVAMGALPGVHAAVNPLFQLLRPIPPLAWIPLAILWLGLGDAAKILVIVCGAFPPVLLNTLSGMRTLDPRLLEAARMLGTPPWRLVLRVLLPGAAPSIFTGLRVGLQASWTTLVAAELVGSMAGLGHILNSAQQDIYPAMIVVAMLCVALLGWLSTSAIGGLEQRAMRGRRPAAAGVAGRATQDGARHPLSGAAGVLAFLLVWLAIARSGLVDPRLLPGPDQVLERIVTLLHDKFAGATLPEHLLASCRLYLTGLVLGVVTGTPLGVLMARHRWLDWIVSPLFDLVRFIAPVAWVPFAALWFGTGIGGPIMIIFFGAFPPCLINAYRGVRAIDPVILEAAAMLGTPAARLWTRVLLPAALPSIVSGLRVSAGLAWQVLVGAELITASAGVGYMMVRAQGAVSTDTVIAGMLAIGLVGAAVDLLLRRLEARVESAASGRGATGGRPARRRRAGAMGAGRSQQGTGVAR